MGMEQELFLKMARYIQIMQSVLIIFYARVQVKNMFPKMKMLDIEIYRHNADAICSPIKEANENFPGEFLQREGGNCS